MNWLPWPLFMISGAISGQRLFQSPGTEASLHAGEPPGQNLAADPAHDRYQIRESPSASTARQAIAKQSAERGIQLIPAHQTWLGRLMASAFKSYGQILCCGCFLLVFGV
ncbi:hypothetical protein K3724_01620 [Leisingera sp. M658]|nr:hypothetical protein [Leisingera sp. M658]UWQ75200.1 hypothetical protein K3724_01620 [Leisingera sp. M658]